MDSREEIARDEWWQKNLGTCYTCEHYYKGICHYYDEMLEYIDADLSNCEHYIEVNLAKRISESRKRTYERIKEANITP